MSGERLHNMKAVELRTGLNASLIRVWERRYGAVSPARSGNQRRLYSEEEVERLTLLGRLTQSGLAISQIAGLSVDQLRVMQKRTADAAAPPAPELLPARSSTITTDPAELIEAALAAIRLYNMAELEKILDRGMVGLGYSGLLEKMLIPLLRTIGDAWERGELTAGHEHGATAAFKDYLARNFRSMTPADTAPRLLVTTPSGQLHEMGAAIVAGLARKAGWHVTYLGPSLPAEEIVAAVMSNHFRAVALSIIYPEDDPELPTQLLRLRQLLPAEIPIIAGGRAVAGYRTTLDRIGALVLGEMSDFTRLLGQIRTDGSAAAAAKVS